MEAADLVASLLPLAVLGLPILAGILLAMMARMSRLQPLFQRIDKPSLVVVTGGILALLILLAPSIFGGVIYEFPWAAIRMDSENMAPLIAVAIIFFLSSIFNMQAEQGGRLKPEIYNLFVLSFLTSMLGLVLVHDVFAVALFIELVIAVSVILVVHAKGKEATEASFKYLIITAVSALLVVLGAVLVYVTTQTSNIPEILANPASLGGNSELVLLIGVFFIVGVGADIGIAPFHGWLPDVFPASKPAVNCFFAAEPIALFIALYRLLHMLYAVSPSMILSLLVIGVGLFSLVFGVLLAYAQDNFMRLIAYATIEEFGYVMIVFSLFTPLSYAVGQLYLLNASIMKLAILLSLGSVFIASGTMNMRLLGGLRKRMPSTSLVYLIAIISLAGIAPLSGFITKWLLLGVVYQHILATAGMMLAIGMLLLLVSTSLVAFIFLVRSYHMIFAGPEKEYLRNVKEGPWEIWVPAVITAAIIIFFGLMPHLFMAFVT
jgi:formate hydrogenlyase subunit 3/multisubunit Na+/H+ antiporter MnhD subunit